MLNVDELDDDKINIILNLLLKTLKFLSKKMAVTEIYFQALIGHRGNIYSVPGILLFSKIDGFLQHVRFLHHS